MVRSRRDREDDLPPATQSVPPAPGWSAGGAAVPPSDPATRAMAGEQPSDIDSGGFGLLSGRDHPDGPILYSGGQWPDRPTSVIGDQPGGSGPTPGRTAGTPGGPYSVPTGDDGPSTQRWRPDFTAPAPTDAPGPAVRPAGGATGDDGPSTQQWRPDFTSPGPTDQPPSAGPDDGDERPGGRHHNN
jgi:hypothetical protein